MKKQNVRTLSLIVCTFTYLLVGAAVFDSLESETEKKRWEVLQAIEKMIIRKYKISTDDYKVMETVVLKSEPHKAGQQWKFTGAFYYATTVLTTIGYGHSTPTTVGGKLFTMCYACLGIPLGLVMFQSIGERVNQLSSYLIRLVKRSLNCRHQQATEINLICVVTTLSSLTIAGGAAAFSKFEGWSYFDSVYYCFITLTTIGFGDMVALQKDNALNRKPEYVMFALIFILFGLAIVAASLNLLVLRFVTMNTEDERRDEAQAMQALQVASNVRLDGDVITANGGPAHHNRNPFYFDERAEKASLYLGGGPANSADQQLCEKFGLLCSQRSDESFPRNSSSRDPLARGAGGNGENDEDDDDDGNRSRGESSGRRFHFLRQWFLGGGGVELQEPPEGSISPYEAEQEDGDEGEETAFQDCYGHHRIDYRRGIDLELRRLGATVPAAAAVMADDFVDDGVDLGMDFEEEINDLVASYPHYSEALEAAAELQSLRRRELEFGSDSSSLQMKRKRGKRRKGDDEGAVDVNSGATEDLQQRRRRLARGCQCCACFRAPSEEQDVDEEGEEDGDEDLGSCDKGDLDALRDDDEDEDGDDDVFVRGTGVENRSLQRR